MATINGILRCATLRSRADTESNFIQLLNLRKIDNPDLEAWLDKKVEKYTSPEIQNEILRLMSIDLLRSNGVDS